MCERCGGVGWVYEPSDAADGLWHLNGKRSAKTVRCVCREADAKQGTQRKLEALDGLTAAERGHRFETAVPVREQSTANYVLSHAFRGIYSLQGSPGIGKSYLLHCVVNQAREQGRVAVYAPMPDVLDYLRAAFDPKKEETYEERWKLLISCEVLALDELDEFKSSEWAHERFLRLIDERSRRRDTLLTVVALNGSIASLAPKVTSRLRQGEVFDLDGVDLRAVMNDREAYPA